eukprot:11577287-Ditylum_brightwellii.AAC.1
MMNMVKMKIQYQKKNVEKWAQYREPKEEELTDMEMRLVRKCRPVPPPASATPAAAAKVIDATTSTAAAKDIDATTSSPTAR